ncbi:TIGR03759 family integrating conjugative element protein [Legionella septentrionalis]|uniref:TIGR03759 family integrating conjugative element protein n=1 Tax=Legionella septentrionalis TaxID=2498109 RepID=A0A3S0XSS6_9GAMM|nr:TIGR03759 family integrating conjugative element protein [Legionella septentrionalis]RUQ85142.1 TIGR03759 family integrating conjugative element protein [Legionella septentrionalis]
MRKFSLIAFGILLSQHALASLHIPGVVTQNIQNGNNALTKAGLIEFHDEVIEEKNIKLTEDQLNQAKVWGLTAEEEKRYLQLLQSRSGVYYKNLRLTPVDILGLNARTDSERKHLAEIAAIHEAQKVAQNIAWNNAFYQAYNQIFQDVPVVGNFDPFPYSPYAHQPLSLKEGDNLYFFIRENDAVRTILLQIIDAITTSQNTKLQLLFVEMDNEAIQLWANRNQIPKSLVSNHQIILASGTQQFDALKLDGKKTPLLLLARDNTSQIVDLGRF